MGVLTIYGFTSLGAAIGFERLPLSVRGQRVSVVMGEEIAALVGRTPRGWFWQPRKKRALLRLQDYQRQLERLMGLVPVLPAKFETRLPQMSKVREILETCGGDLAEPISQYGDLIQFDVSVCWSVIDAIEQLRQTGIVGLKFGASAEQNRQAALVLKEAVEGHRKALMERIRMVIQGVSLDMIEVPRTDETVVAAFTILLRRADEIALDRVLESFDRETGGSLRIRCVGPLPACSFAAVEVGAMDSRAIEAARRRLNLRETVTAQEIKQAYREAVRAVHPDTNPEYTNASEAVTRLKDAYGLLARVARGQQREGTSAPVINLQPNAVQSGFSVRLRRAGEGEAEAA